MRRLGQALGAGEGLMTTGAGDVDLVVNVFERTYRRLTEPSVFERLATAHRFPFARRVLLVNNVDDPTDARARAARLVHAGEVDEVHFVAERLDRALEVCGLTRSQLEPLLHFCDAPLVAITLPGSPWLVYWDAEATLDRHVDWITPARAQLAGDRRLLIANPSWERPLADGSRPGVEHEAVRTCEDFALGAGFSDQAFLVLREDVAGPIYEERCIGTLVHPRAHQGRTFEARVNAHMRHHGRLRATYLGTSYSIDQPASAVRRPPRGVRERVRYARNGAILRLLCHSPWRPRCLRHTWIGRSAPSVSPAANPAVAAYETQMLNAPRRRILPRAAVLAERQPAGEVDDLLGV